MALVEFRHPFFQPVWRRVVLVVALVGWGIFDFVTGSPFWGVLFAGVGAVAAYQFFFDWTDDETGSDQGDM